MKIILLQNICLSETRNPMERKLSIGNLWYLL